jgi:hypothetical protein
MKSLLLLSACGLALTGVSACAPVNPPTARVALDCPSEVGRLKLSNIAPDKKSCLYSTRGGDEVSLRLVSVSGNYEAALQPIEAELQTEIAAETASTGEESDTKPGAPIATAAASAASDASAAAKQATDDARGAPKSSKEDGDNDSKIDIGGGTDRDDHAHIDLPGIHISADDDKADVDVAGVHVNAGENGATVRMSRDVRLRGEALSPERRGFRATFILARDDLKDSWRSVGYEAAGPKSGPITVAVFKTHEGARHDVSDDIKRLVRRNGGV